ncbi:hypothetical protein D7X25_28455 [bacterium 1XD42-8]|jgi:Ribonuclease G/E|nr:hypothetical protein D7X25_28455 [bacterium 1XD42-8]
MEERKRTKELCRVGEKIFARNFRESIAYLQEKYTKEEEWKKVEGMLREAWEEGKKGGKKSPWLGILYSHISLLQRTHEFLFLVTEENLVLDEEPVERWGRFPHFFERYEEDMKKVMKELERTYPRIQTYEENQVREACAPYYYAGVRGLLEGRIERLKRFCLGGEIYFGRYRGEGWILGKEGKKWKGKN